MAAARAQAIAACAAVGALCAGMMAPAGAGLAALAVEIALLAFAVSRKLGPLFHLALFAALWAAVAVFAPASRVWPWGLLAPLTLYALAFRFLRATAPEIRRGRLGAQEWRWILVIAAVSSCALVLWVRFASPDMSPHLANIPEIPTWAYPLAAAAFAVGNAAIEEVAFRGIVMGALEALLGRGPWPVLLQAAAFGAAHFARGFPNGWVGFALALAYGLMLGALCRRSGGLLAPWVAHVCADLTIFALVAAVQVKL